MEAKNKNQSDEAEPVAGLSETVANLRQNYARASLSIDDTAEDPLDQFHKWLDEAIASDIVEPNAMTLATVGESGAPSARTLLLKGLEDGGLTFYTNYTSRKAKELENNAHVSVLFLWKELQRQVEIRGSVEKASPEVSESYFHSRPYGHQIGAWVSTQSAVIPNREWMEERSREFREKYPENGPDPVPLPEFWGGYRLLPNAFEFWQGRESRLHDRIYYEMTPDGEKWNRLRLSP